MERSARAEEELLSCGLERGKGEDLVVAGWLDLMEEEMDLVGWCVKSRRGWIPREIWWSGGGGWLGGWDISLNFRVGLYI